jgi:adenylylsulfate kinase
LPGWAIWLTGLPGCGKSTIASLLTESLRKNGIQVQVISMDMLRKVITPRPTYSSEERKIVYDALVFVAHLLTKNNVNVLIDATANRRIYRAKASRLIPLFMEAYLKCPLEICMAREARRKVTHGAPKRIYRRGINGRSKTVPGLGAPYEEPSNPAVTVETDKLTVKQSASKILKTLNDQFDLNIDV